MKMTKLQMWIKYCELSGRNDCTWYPNRYTKKDLECMIEEAEHKNKNLVKEVE